MQTIIIKNTQQACVSAGKLYSDKITDSRYILKVIRKAIEAHLNGRIYSTNSTFFSIGAEWSKVYGHFWLMQ